LFSNSTLNMAFGSGSSTVAITSIASSLLIDSLEFAFSLWLLAFGSQLDAQS
jgi:tetrahydromethanopterin S-methyltransferase subunit C